MNYEDFERKALKTCDVEPIMSGSIIGKNVWRCSKCYNRIDRKDQYCRSCGCRLYDKMPTGGNSNAE